MQKSILLSEIQKIETTSLTPIEIALGVDKEGRTTARKLYGFLELSKGQFSRWSKTNITENLFAIEHEDYEGFDIVVEGNITKDYKLSASFAKKLAMGTHNFKGEAAKNYFIKVEEKLKEAVVNPYKGLSKEVQAIFAIDKKTQEIDSRITKLENNMTIDYAQQETLNSLAKKVVVQALGGYGTPAYKELNKKAFSALWKDYKRVMQVNSYKNTAVKQFTRAKDLINSWEPNRELELMIKGANTQMSF